MFTLKIASAIFDEIWLFFDLSTSFFIKSFAVLSVEQFVHCLYRLLLAIVSSFVLAPSVVSSRWSLWHIKSPVVELQN